MTFFLWTSSISDSVFALTHEFLKNLDADEDETEFEEPIEWVPPLSRSPEAFESELDKLFDKFYGKYLHALTLILCNKDGALQHYQSLRAECEDIASHIFDQFGKGINFCLSPFCF